MRPVKVKRPYWDFPNHDLDLIARALALHDYSSTPEQCQLLWALHSDSVCAGWLGLPDDLDLIFDSVRPYIDESEN